MATQTATTALQPARLFAPNTASQPPANAPQKPVEQRTRQYRDFLTPALHRRFTHAALLLLAASYLTSILISPPSILWIWNPLSFVGMRALLLFLPCLAVFIVRVANMRVGDLNTTSGVDSAWLIAKDWKTMHTLACYFWSAWFFGEVYLWSKSESANLSWVDRGRSYDGGLAERPVLNENPIFLRCVWLCLAFAEAARHLVKGDDRLLLAKKTESPKTGAASKLPEPLGQLVEHLPEVLSRTLILLIPGVVLSLPIYFILLRRAVWSFVSALASILYSDLSSSRPTGMEHLMRLGFQTFASSFFLVALWELSSAVFTAYVSQPPVRRDQPLTGEIKDERGVVRSRSNDPNGSLLNGLKSRKEVTRAFAFWELSIICDWFETRRKTIYTEVDRKDGSTWAQISECCLNTLNDIQKRIRDAQTPSSQITPSPTPPSSQNSQLLGLPKIADRQVIPNGDVLQKPRTTELTQHIGSAVKAAGQSPQSAQAVQLRARKALEWTADHMLSKSEQDRLSRANLAKDANGTIVSILRSPLGEPLRHTFARRVRAVVFGSPAAHGSRANIVHASQALCALCVNSLKDDDYGQVARAIPAVLRAYTATITAIVAFVATLAPHWTDVEFDGRRRRVPEVEEVLDVLKAGLEGVLLAFGEYADAVGVTRKELREAKEALGKGLEMREVR